MGFEVFERPKPGPAADEVMRVRVGAEGRSLHLNSRAYKALGKPRRVLLYRDGESIGFGRAETDDLRAYAAMQGNISCTHFIEQVGLVPGARLVLRFESGILRTDGT